MSIPVLALVFVCGVLAGFGIYAVVSSGPGAVALSTANAPNPIGPCCAGITSLRQAR